MLTGVYKPTAGTIVFDGVDITGKPPHAITKLGIGRTFQNIRLFPQMTALENVLVGMHSRMQCGHLRRGPARPADASRGAGGDGAGPASCSATPGSRAATTPTPRACRTATSGGSRSRARSPPIRS